MTRYTVFNSQNSAQTDGRGLTALQAMDAILSHDGFAWKFRRARDGRLTLWHSDASANSTRGAGHFVRTVCGSYEPGLAGQRDIAQQVIAARWHGQPEAMIDADYDAMIAAAAE